MGGICPILPHKTQSQNGQNNENKDKEPTTTERTLKNMPKDGEEEAEPNPNTTEKKTILNDSVNSNTTTGKIEKFTKNMSTALGSSVLERKNSSLLFQGCIFESSSIILKNNRENIPGVLQSDQNCYVLIDKVFLVKKSMDSIKVMSPHSQSQLNCPINNIPSTFYLSEGAPLDSIKEISAGKIIQVSQSPIRTKLKLICKYCELVSKRKDLKVRKVQMTFSTSLIHVKEIVCDECQYKGQWRILSIQSNFPVWGNGHKIQKDQTFEQIPSTIRIMGCISCLRYTESQELPCGCFICKNCLSQNQSPQCKLCEGVY